MQSPSLIANSPSCIEVGGGIRVESAQRGFIRVSDGGTNEMSVRDRKKEGQVKGFLSVAGDIECMPNHYRL